MKKLESMAENDRAGMIGTMSTAELVEWFNAHSEAPVKKFADRKTAERRVLALAADISIKKSGDVHSTANSRIAATMPKRIEKAVNLGVDEAHSAAIAETWLDPAVAAARAIRDHVMVDGRWFVSVRQAFIDLDLPLGEHIKFRAQLKRARKLEAYNMKWAITKDPARSI